MIAILWFILAIAAAFVVVVSGITWWITGSLWITILATIISVVLGLIWARFA